MAAKKKQTERKRAAHPFVIVRTTGAGIHCGELVKRDGADVTLKNARRIWRWRGANTLHELSLRGGDGTWTRISEPVAEITIVGCHEVIPCTQAGRDNLSRSRWPA